MLECQCGWTVFLPFHPPAFPQRFHPLLVRAGSSILIILLEADVVFWLSVIVVPLVIQQFADFIGFDILRRDMISSF